MSIPEILNECDEMKVYLRYKISLTWAMKRGLYNNVHWPNLPPFKIHIFGDQILSFEEWKRNWKPSDTYLGINLK